MTATAIVLGAIYNTRKVPGRKPGSRSYWNDCLAQRAGASPDRLGSIYPDRTPEQVEEMLLGAEWTPYNHASIDAPVIGYRAEIPGLVGVCHIDTIPPSTRLTLVSYRKDSDRLVPVARNLLRIPVGFTVALVGPDEVVGDTIWSFFPGEPIRGCQLEAGPHSPGDTLSVAQARQLGLQFVKVGS